MTTIIVIIRMTRLCYPLGKVPINHDIIRNKVNMFSENSLSRPKDNNAYFRSPTHILSITSPPPAFIELILLILPNLGKYYHHHYHHHHYHTPPHHDPLVLAFLFLPPACLPSDFFTDYFPSITSSPSSSPPPTLSIGTPSK